LSVKFETNLLSLINPWLNKFYQITTKSATVTFTQIFSTKHSLSKPGKRKQGNGVVLVDEALNETSSIELAGRDSKLGSNE
jgi:hypothetical protein